MNYTKSHVDPKVGSVNEKQLTAAASKVHRSLFCMFFFVTFIDLESMFTGTGALEARYSSQIAWTLSWTSFCGRHFSSWTAVRNLDIQTRHEDSTLLHTFSTSKSSCIVYDGSLKITYLVIHAVSHL